MHLASWVIELIPRCNLLTKGKYMVHQDTVYPAVYNFLNLLIHSLRPRSSKPSIWINFPCSSDWRVTFSHHLFAEWFHFSPFHLSTFIKSCCCYYFYGIKVLSVKVLSASEGEPETSFSSLLTAVETHGAQFGAEAQRVLLELSEELSEELSQAGEVFDCFRIFALHLQRKVTTF